MNEYRPSGFRILPPVVKGLLLVNVIVFLGMEVLHNVLGIDLTDYLAFHYFKSPHFKPHQLVSYMFLHGNLMHLFFNMFALWMFGNTLENVWGPKRFLTYYMITGIGAAIVQLIVTHIRLMPLYDQVSAETLANTVIQGAVLLREDQNYTDPVLSAINLLVNIPTVGASGAVFGILLAFGMLFPNTLLYVYFAIPIKAKWFVMIYGAIELFSGIADTPGDNVAHFAHLGGMLFGYLMIIYWRKKTNRF